MDFMVKSVHMTEDGLDLFFGFVDTGDEYHRIHLNTNQLVLLHKQSAEIISRCSVVRPIL